MPIKSIAIHALRALDHLVSKLSAVGNFRPPKGTFSALEALTDGKLEGRILIERQDPGICPAGSMTELAAFKQHDHQPWPVFWTCSDEARLVGRMMHWRDPQDRICEEALYGNKGRRQLGEDNVTAQIWLPKATVLPGAWTSITSYWSDGGNYYHWLLDSLTRLAVRESLPERTGILIPPGCPRYVSETMHLLSIEHEIYIPATANVRPERYYFCSPSSMTGVWNPMGYNWLRKSFSPHFAPPKSGSAVFLTRRSSARMPSNIAEIELAFKSNGYEIVDCGTISVREQIKKISAAPAIAGLHGAAMTNILWANPGTPVLELFQPGYLNGCYEQIAFQGHLNYSHCVLKDDHLLLEMKNLLRLTGRI